MRRERLGGGGGGTPEDSHQAEEGERQLDDVGVGHGVEPPQQGVDDGHGRGDPHTVGEGQVQDDADGDP